MEASARAWRRAAATGRSIMQQGRPQQSSESARQAFVYEAPGTGVRVSLDFSVMNRLASEALRGLSALPRRGLEVGGLLLGSAGWLDGTLEIAVDDCVPFSCEHLYGPNFQLSPKDREGFAALVSSWAPTPGRKLQPVGFYRSHTRGELELTAEDVEILDTWLPQPHALCLLIRPFFSRPAEAAFFFRQQGVFRPGPPDRTFPLRRRELGGEALPRQAAPSVASSTPPEAAKADPAEKSHLRGGYVLSNRVLGSWLLVLLLMVFLLVGVVIGVELAAVIRPPQAPAASSETFALGLSAVQVGEAIHLRWKPQAPALAACRSASLIIRDGSNTKILDLRKEDLARGALIYRHSSSTVGFRMEAILSPGNTVSETIDLRLMPADGGPGAEGSDPLQ